ncbi:MAG: 3-deoxy-7-phosphoheptulonate synthase [Methanobacteriota archaeon]|nr:MAG: 3-deoxy-7-phosphoheptulonate synthase [Euryarchaeota archaeon]
MIIVLRENVTEEQKEQLRNHILENGMRIHESAGVERTIWGIIGDERLLSEEKIQAFPAVEKVLRVLEPYKLASRKFKHESTVIQIGKVKVGGDQPVVIAGPCSVESEEQIFDVAREVAENGGHMLRGGIFKPRTSPYAFQGHGVKAAQWIKDAGKEYGLPVVSEVMEINDIDVLYEYVDVFQVGARNMQNYKLLKALGRTQKPILLKRGMSATMKEFLMSAEYILNEGNPNVILCERGIRTFSDFSRNTFDINIVPMIKNVSHLPIVVDPSHATGRTDLVIPMTLAGLIAGADGFMVEVHPKPFEAFSDGDQSLNYEQFRQLIHRVERVTELVIEFKKELHQEIIANAPY